MADLNSVSLIGRLARDPERRTTSNGKSWTSITIANNTGYGEYEKVNWINVAAYGSTADFLVNYGVKGDLLSVSGQLIIDQSEVDGKTVTYTKVVSNEIHRLNGKRDNSAKDEPSTPAPKKSDTKHVSGRRQQYKAYDPEDAF